MTAGTKTGLTILGVVLAVAVVLTGAKSMVFGAERKTPLVAPAVDEVQSSAHEETAVLAGGCFWGVQSVYNRVKGVKHTVAGYSGGSKETANYRAVSSEQTDHAESLKIVLDPQVESYGRILRIFFMWGHVRP